MTGPRTAAVRQSHHRRRWAAALVAAVTTASGLGAMVAARAVPAKPIVYVAILDAA